MTSTAPSPNGGAVDAAAFAAAMAKFAIPHGGPKGAKIAVGVSGGADSMALLLLLRDWSARQDIALTALTVDHCLRDASAAEATQVAAWCRELGVAHVVLRWEEGVSQRDLSRSPQAAARTARYELLTGWCRAHQHTHLYIAHHADDQIETFFMRLSRGSGVDGLAAMAAASKRSGVTLLRPLLDFPKNALIATCEAAGQTWIEDPSNESGKSTRVRFRRARALLAAEGLDDSRLLATVDHLQRARKALESGVEGLLVAACAWDAWGRARLNLAPFVAAPEEISLRALAHVLTAVSGAEYGPRFERLARLHQALSSGPWRDATLHGCQIAREGTDVVISREAHAIIDTRTVTSGESVIWDGRFRIDVQEGDDLIFTVERLTSAAWKQASEAGADSSVSHAVRETLPMLTDGRGLAALPWASYIRPDLLARLKARISPVFTAYSSVFGCDDDPF